jgi:hypothetical protein
MKKSGLALAVLAVLAALAVQGRGPAQVGGTAATGFDVHPGLGPWMICTTYYTGPEARQLATRLVTELREHYHLPAYIFNYTDEERQKEEERIRKERERIRQILEQQERALGQMEHAPVAPIHIRTRRFEDQCGVLLGGYKDEKSARADLDHIKKLEPPDPKRVPMATIWINNPVKKMLEQTYVSPFAKSFVVPNPTIKREQAAERNQPDPFLKRFNEGEAFNLLKCPKHFTLAVSQFHGASTVQSQLAPEKSSFLDKLGMGGGESLQASALNAHNVAELLRKLNLEAYVLHTRYYSLVTVGGFDSLDDPRLRAAQRQLAQLMPKLSPIPMLPKALPVDVEAVRGMAGVR